MRRLVTIATLGAILVAAAVADGASFAEVNVSSHLRGSQAEVAVAADPSNASVLFAASNSIDLGRIASLRNLMRTYTSVDGGGTWKVGAGPTPTPYGGRERCNAGDPAPAIDAAGRQYLAFLATQCLSLTSLVLGEDDEFDVARLEIAMRPSSTSPWVVSQVYPVRSARFDDKPTIAVDDSAASPHAGRVYAAWTRITPGKTRRSVVLLIVVSHSDDHGATWSKPVVVPDARADETTFAGLAVDSAGTLFVSWADTARRLLVDRSVDGGETFGTDVVVTRAGFPAFPCEQPGSFLVPAQTKRCLTPTPTITVDSRPEAPEHVYVTYSSPDAAGRAQDVVVRTYDAALAPLDEQHPVHPADTGRDEFMSASAVDEQGRLWVCYYDTGNDRSRRTTRYTCTASADGGATFAPPRAVASVASNETTRLALEFQYGDYEGLAVAGGVAHPVWTDGRELGTAGEEIYASTLGPADLQLP
jgi:hypothetical protein